MESSPDLIAHLLGIDFPVHVLAVKTDALPKLLHIHIETPIDHVADPGDDWSLWHHLPLGGYSVQIHSQTKSVAVGAEGVNFEHLQDPSILGPSNREYTHALRQRVALAYHWGHSAKAIGALIASRTEDIQPIIEQILEDIQRSSPLNQLLACLPTEQDVIWRKLLSGEKQLKAQNLAFRLLLSKWQTQVSIESVSDMSGVYQLRKYLVMHGAQLIDEIKLIAGLPSSEAPSGAFYGR